MTLAFRPVHKIAAFAFCLTSSCVETLAQESNKLNNSQSTRHQITLPAGNPEALKNQAAAKHLVWGLRPPAGTKVHRDISYVPGSKNKAQTLDLYVSEKPQGKQNLVVWIHGGGWRSGSKRMGPFSILLDNGFAVASIDYRLTGEAQFPAQIHDCKAAIRWLRTHANEYNLNTNRIGVWGASAGGHLVALLGTTNGDKSLEGTEGNLDRSSAVQAVCDWFGPTNIAEMGKEKQKPGFLPTRKLIEDFLGGSVSEKESLANQASPVFHVTKGAPPFLIMHGDHDRVVPESQSEELYAELKAKGADATLNVIKGAGHGAPGFGNTAKELVFKFFDQHLRK